MIIYRFLSTLLSASIFANFQKWIYKGIILLFYVRIILIFLSYSSTLFPSVKFPRVLYTHPDNCSNNPRLGMLKLILNFFHNKNFSSLEATNGYFMLFRKMKVLNYFQNGGRLWYTFLSDEETVKIQSCFVYIKLSINFSDNLILYRCSSNLG